MEKSFWSDGLKFECSRCSKCCRYEPGYVFLTVTDIKKMLNTLKIDFLEFMEKYAKLVDMGTHYNISLIEKPNNDCIMWNKTGCLVYNSRPIQCSTYPFWDNIITNKASWLSESNDCPGIGHGHLFTASEIEDSILKRRLEPVLVINYGTTLESVNENTFLGCKGLSSDTANS